MKRNYRILVLTDHSGHSNQNSIYAILSQMKSHPRCSSIDIASRGLLENKFFFDKMQSESLYVNEVHSNFEYSDCGKHYSNNLKKYNSSDYDIVFLRLPRPISDDFLHWIDVLFSRATIVNKPSGIIMTSNKKYLINFPELCPGVRLCNSLDDIQQEIAKYPIVLKPLKEYGGKGLLKIEGTVLHDGYRKHNTSNYLSTMKEYVEEEGMLSMRYLKNVNKGDKRILVVGGEIQAASLRLPAEGSWLCNVAQGGKSIYSEVTLKEKKIIDTINPFLKENGILVYGADTLEDDNGERVLSEINTLSIGGFPQAEAQTGKPIIKTLIDSIFNYADERNEGYTINRRD